MDYVDPAVARFHKRPHDGRAVILESGGMTERGHAVRSAALLRHVEHRAPEGRDYCTITCRVETDRGTAYLLYERGYYDMQKLEDAALFVRERTGPAALVLRAIIALDGAADERT